MSYQLFEYKIIITPDKDGKNFTAQIAEIPEISCTSENPVTALRSLLESYKNWVEKAKKLGRNIPVPYKYMDFKSEVTLHLSEKWHRMLSEKAEQKGTTIKKEVVNSLYRGLTGEVQVQRSRDKLPETNDEMIREIYYSVKRIEESVRLPNSEESVNIIDPITDSVFVDIFDMFFGAPIKKPKNLK